MRMKQVATAVAVLMGAALPAQAEDGQGNTSPTKGQRSITTESGTEIIIRSESDKRRRDEDNDNRQSGPGATRGLERADERRPQPAPDATDERPWYDPFGWLPSDTGPEDPDEDSGWWPFD